MREAPFRIEPLKGQNRTGFSSGEAALDTYLQTRARQDVRRRVSACFVMVEASSGRIVGYYTLAACHLQLADIDEELKRKLPRYPTVPAVLLGRLAVDLQARGQGIGGVLIADAAARALRSEIAAHMMVVHAKSEVAAAFYRHHGFRTDPQEPLRLYAPLASLTAE